MSNISGVSAKPVSCCEEIQEAFGRCWTWITSGCHWCLDKLVQAVDVVAFGFFRVVGCFAPQWALRLEAGYGYFSTWYARYSASVQQEVSHATITDLEAVNRGLHSDVMRQTRDLTALQVTHQRVSSERGRLEAERDADIAARIRLEIQEQLMQQRVDLSDARSKELIAQNQRVQEELQRIIAGRAPVLAENRVLGDLVGELQKQNERLQLDTQHAKGERDLAYRAMQVWRRIQQPWGAKTAPMKALPHTSIPTR